MCSIALDFRRDTNGRIVSAGSCYYPSDVDKHTSSVRSRCRVSGYPDGPTTCGVHETTITVYSSITTTSSVRQGVTLLDLGRRRSVFNTVLTMRSSHTQALMTRSCAFHLSDDLTRVSKTVVRDYNSLLFGGIAVVHLFGVYKRSRLTLIDLRGAVIDGILAEHSTARLADGTELSCLKGLTDPGVVRVMFHKYIIDTARHYTSNPRLLNWVSRVNRDYATRWRTCKWLLSNRSHEIHGLKMYNESPNIINLHWMCVPL